MRSIDRVVLSLLLVVGCGGSVEVFGEASGTGGASSGNGSGVGTSGQGPSTGAAGAPPVTTGIGVGGSSGTAVGPGTSGVATSSGSGGPVCDNSGDCGTCVTCAWSSTCAAYANACSANPECVAIVNCYQTCMGECTVQCWVPHPNGQTDYLAMAICIYCDNCFNDCDSGSFGCP